MTTRFGMKRGGVAVLGLTLLWTIADGAFGSEPAKVIKNVVVYREDGMFGGWPANHGIWIWGNEILVGFSKGRTRTGVLTITSTMTSRRSSSWRGASMVG